MTNTTAVLESPPRASRRTAAARLLLVPILVLTGLTSVFLDTAP